MASKGFSSSLCIYCGTHRSTPTGDHVIARQLLLETARNNLPKVPCCANCNSKKSTLEHYLATVLPFGNRQSSAPAALKASEVRLRKNLKLHRQLSAGVTEVSDPVDSAPTIAIPFDFSKLADYMEWVTKALLFHELDCRMGTEDAKAFLASNEGDVELRRNFLSLNGRRCIGEFGDGAVSFESLTRAGTPILSIWRFTLFGGMIFSEGNGSSSPFIWVSVGPKATLERF